MPTIPIGSSTDSGKEQSIPQPKNITVSSTTKISLLTKHLQPLSELQPKVPQKTRGARVLTSTECLAALEEKRLRKEAEIEQREKNKQERLRKKQEKEEAMRRKKEENEVKKRERQEAARLKREENEKKKAEREKQKQQKALALSIKKGSGRGGAASTRTSTRSGSSNSTSTAASQSPITMDQPGGSASSLSVPMDIQGESNDCTFCYGPYDAGDGREWVRCACGQWVHEDCLEDIFIDDNGLERFCPYCLKT